MNYWDLQKGAVAIESCSEAYFPVDPNVSVSTLIRHEERAKLQLLIVMTTMQTDSTCELIYDVLAACDNGLWIL